MIKNLIILALVTMNVVFGWAMYQEMRSTSKSPDLDKTSINAELSASHWKILSRPIPRSQNAQDVTASKVPLTGLDHGSLVDQLRQSGYDESMLRQIMLATINRDHLLLEANTEKAPYWKPVDIDMEEKLTKQLSWEADRRQQLLSLFGAEIVDDPMFEDIFKPLNDSLSFLSSEKQIQLNELKRRDSAKARELYSGGFTQESKEDLQAQRQNLQRQIAEVLGTQDAFEYQIRESYLANRMRQGLSDFDYSEQEFRDIFTIRQSQEGVDSSGLSNRSEYRLQRQESEAKIRDYLGASRYEDYARSQDPAYRSLQSIGERYGNSTAEINEVYTISRAANDEIDRVRNSSSLNQAQRLERIAEIRQESFDKIERIVGKDTAESVKENARRLGFDLRS